MKFDDEFYEDDYEEDYEEEEVQEEESDNEMIYEAYDPSKHKAEFDQLDFKVSQIRQMIPKSTQEIKKALQLHGSVEGAIDYLLQGNHITALSLEEMSASCVIDTIVIFRFETVLERHEFQKSAILEEITKADHVPNMANEIKKLALESPEDSQKDHNRANLALKTLPTPFSPLSLSSLKSNSESDKTYLSRHLPKLTSLVSNNTISYGANKMLTLKSLSEQGHLKQSIPRQNFGLMDLNSNSRLTELDIRSRNGAKGSVHTTNNSQLASPSAYATFLSNDKANLILNKLKLFRCNITKSQSTNKRIKKE